MTAPRFKMGRAAVERSTIGTRVLVKSRRRREGGGGRAALAARFGMQKGGGGEDRKFQAWRLSGGGARSRRGRRWSWPCRPRSVSAPGPWGEDCPRDTCFPVRSRFCSGNTGPRRDDQQSQSPVCLRHLEECREPCVPMRVPTRAAQSGTSPSSRRGLWWFVPVFVTAGLTTRSQSHGRGLHVPLFLSCKQTGVCHVGGLL